MESLVIGGLLATVSVFTALQWVVRGFDESIQALMGKHKKRPCAWCGTDMEPGSQPRHNTTMIMDFKTGRMIEVCQDKCWKKFLEANEAAKARLGK